MIALLRGAAQKRSKRFLLAGTGRAIANEFKILKVWFWSNIMGNIFVVRTVQHQSQLLPGWRERAMRLSVTGGFQAEAGKPSVRDILALNFWQQEGNWIRWPLRIPSTQRLYEPGIFGRMIYQAPLKGVWATPSRSLLLLLLLQVYAEFGFRFLVLEAVEGSDPCWVLVVA